MDKRELIKTVSKNGITRRSFIGRTALATAAFTIIPRHVLGGKGYIAPSDKLNIACIGIGGKGVEDSEAMQNENVVALCDVDDIRGSETRLKYPNAKFYKDFRVLLDKEKNIDAITVSTPDHT
ncbi:MAG: twin-arginine translocation signal domain-containing protein, partial [Melioribacteraceae bacterium]